MSKIGHILENFIPDAQGVVRRFPLATFMVALFAMIVTLKANDFAILNNDMMGRLVGGTVLAAYLAIVLTLVGEGMGKSVYAPIKLALISAALLISYFYHEFSFVTPMAIGATILWLGSAVFWRQDRNDVAVWDFTHKIWTGVIFTIAGAIIYMFGVFAISTALRSLFGVNIQSFVDKWMFPIGFAFLAPMAWMSMIPKHDDEDDGDSLRNSGFVSKAVGFLGTWILAPLTLVYALILLAYMVKIVMNQSVPNGEVAQLVTPFLLIGTLTWLILDPPFIQEKRLAQWFHKFWFPLMLPASCLLAFAAFVRIREYVMTIERYLLVLACVWALGIAIWFSIKGADKRDIRIIPGFAAMLLVIGSIGPWGADGFSAMSQNARLIQALHANGMLDAQGHIKPKGEYTLADKDAAIQARSALDYLIKTEKEKRINKLLATPINFEITKDEDQWGEKKSIRKKFGLHNVRVPNKYNMSDGKYDETKGKFLRTFDNHGQFTPVTGYDYIQRVSWYELGTSARQTVGPYKIFKDKKDLVIQENGIEVGRVDVVKWLQSKPVDEMGVMQLNPTIVIYANSNKKMALYIESAVLRFEQSKADSFTLSGVLLIKGIEVGEN